MFMPTAIAAAEITTSRCWETIISDQNFAPSGPSFLIYSMKSADGSERTEKFGTKPAATAGQSIFPETVRLATTPKKQTTIAATESFIMRSKNLSPPPPCAYIQTMNIASR